MENRTWKKTTAWTLCAALETLAGGCGGGGGGTTGSSSGGSTPPAATPPSISIGGTVSGLSSNESVVLQNNGGDNLTVEANGSFTFKAALSGGAAYSVTVLTQPAGAACKVASGTGTVGSANITSVAVTCAVNTFTVGGSVNGLPSGATLVLQDNGGDNLTVTANGPFTFPTALAGGATYSVSVLTQPAGATCSATQSSGAISSSNITSVSLQCNQTSAGGTVTPHRMAFGGSGDYSLLVRADGSVIAAGSMPGGATTPISGTAFSQVSGVSPAVAVSADSAFDTSFALQSSGTTLGWGTVFPFMPSPVNVSDLGIGLTTPQGAPVAVSGLSGVSEIKAMSGIVLARNGDGSIWLVPGKSVLTAGPSGSVTTTPIQVAGVGTIQSLGDTGLNNNEVAFPVIDNAGNVTQVNIGTTSLQTNVPNAGDLTVESTYTLTQVGGLPRVSQISCGDGGPICLALGTDGSVWAWGSGNNWGQIGNGTTVGQTIPIQVATLSAIHILQVAVNSSNSYALASDGTVYAWGANNGLGQPFTNSINNLVPNQVPNLTGIIEIVARGPDILARDSQGNVWGWGGNSHGELGTGSTAAVVTPTKAPGINMN